MKLLLLSGNSIRNRDWIEKVEPVMRPLFAETKIHYYRHWETGAESIDMEYEAKMVEQEAREWDDYVVFAKSIGSLLTLKCIYENKLKPKRCLFVGAAIFADKQSNYPVDEWVDAYSTPTLFIQKTADPIISFADLKKYLSARQLKNYSIKEIPGDNHNYDDLEYLKVEMGGLLKE